MACVVFIVACFDLYHSRLNSSSELLPSISSFLLMSATTNSEPVPKPSKGLKPEPTIDPEHVESVQVYELATTSVLELKPEPVFVLEPLPTLATSMNHKPEPTANPEPNPATSDDRCVSWYQCSPLRECWWSWTSWSGVPLICLHLKYIPPHVNSFIPWFPDTYKPCFHFGPV